jgi:hypothetical protein
VGAPLDDLPVRVFDAGSVYVFDLTVSQVLPVATLRNPAPSVGDEFGSAVAISGTRVVVGAPRDSPALTGSGTAYLYDLASASPTTPLVVTNPTPAELDSFGAAVALDGNRLVIAAERDDTAAFRAGAAYVYDLSSPQPTTPVVTLTNADAVEWEAFGHSLALEGNRLAVGTIGDTGDPANAGKVRIYDLGGATPALPIRTVQSPTPEDFERFGSSVALSGNRLVIGAPYDDKTAAEPDVGAAYLYDLGSPTPTVPARTFYSPISPISEAFGDPIAISGDHLVVGAPGPTGPWRGAAPLMFMILRVRRRPCPVPFLPIRAVPCMIHLALQLPFPEISW